ncbi:hypothetical protein D3C76_511070 [compost metagenome]
MADGHEKRPKTISLEVAVHKKLKMLCAEQGWTMTQAVEALLQRMEETEDERHGRNQAADKGR